MSQSEAYFVDFMERRKMLDEWQAANDRTLEAFIYLWLSLVIGVVVTSVVRWTTHTVWGVLAYAPFVYYVGVSTVRLRAAVKTEKRYDELGLS